MKCAVMVVYASHRYTADRLVPGMRDFAENGLLMDEGSDGERTITKSANIDTSGCRISLARLSGL
jgi:hypothetical protein